MLDIDDQERLIRVERKATEALNKIIHLTENIVKPLLEQLPPVVEQMGRIEDKLDAIILATEGEGENPAAVEKINQLREQIKTSSSSLLAAVAGQTKGQ